MEDAPVLWRRLDRPGHESARILSRGRELRLSGCAVFAHDGQPCRLDYEVVCDAGWSTLSASVAGWVGASAVDVRVVASADRRWHLNGAECPQVEGCIDVDLNFSPSTNLLPIRRLGLGVGEAANVRAAWLRFPQFTLEPIRQLYRRTGPLGYRYESGEGAFARDLGVSETGWVTDYPDFWRVETGR